MEIRIRDRNPKDLFPKFGIGIGIELTDIPGSGLGVGIEISVSGILDLNWNFGILALGVRRGPILDHAAFRLLRAKPSGRIFLN